MKIKSSATYNSVTCGNVNRYCIFSNIQYFSVQITKVKKTLFRIRKIRSLHLIKSVKATQYKKEFQRRA